MNERDALPIHEVHSPSIQYLSDQPNSYVDLSKGDSEVLDFINNRGKLDVVLQQPSTSFNFMNGYNIPPKSKGLSLIINIIEFDMEYRMRHGADSDTKGLTELLYQLSYEVHPRSQKIREKPRKSKIEVEELIEMFRKECNKRNPASIIVYVGSHGGHAPSEISTSDMQYLHLFEDIVKKFSHTNCPALIGKPKIFITSACNSLEKEEVPQFEWREDFDMDDTMICLPGLISYRDLDKGSWLAYCLTYAICQHAKDKSFQEILGIVKYWIAKIGKEAVPGKRITSEHAPVFLDWKMKTLYFSFENNEQVELQESANKITYQKSLPLGEGGFGKVYMGTFQKKEVAVKVVDCTYLKFAENEISTLCELERHPNVILYYAIERLGDSFLIALELCSSNLVDWLENPDNSSKISHSSILENISEGLNHIHKRGIIHKDLKPDNVLIQEKPGDIRVLISDFGLGRKLPEGKKSFTNSKSQIGSYAWMAPEIWCKERLTNAVDIFSLGCVFYFVSTDGDHPFGSLDDSIVIPGKIREGNYKKPLSIPNDTAGISKLIEKMIQTDSHHRPSVELVLKHPMFWDNGKKMKFFNDIKLTVFNKTYKSFFDEIESEKDRVFSGSWIDLLEDPIQREVKKKGSGKYDFCKFMDLLRLVRNKDEHYDELSDEVKSIVGSKPNYVSYWLNKFPELLPYSWEKFEALKNDECFIHSEYY